MAFGGRRKRRRFVKAEARITQEKRSLVLMKWRAEKRRLRRVRMVGWYVRGCIGEGVITSVLLRFGRRTRATSGSIARG